MRLLIPRKSPLIRPDGRNPAYDPTHLAGSGNIRYSGVAANGGAFVNLLNGSKSSPTSTTGLITGIGPVAQTASGATAFNQVSSPFATGVVPGAVTCAAIITFLSNAAGGVVGFADGSGNYYIRTNSGALFGTNAATTLVPTLGVPYFIAMSVIGTAANFIMTNLLTGQTQTQAITYTGGLLASAATWSIGGQSSTTRSGTQIAAVMYSTSGLSKQQLSAWAQRPWDFWYPPTAFDVIRSQLTLNLAAQLTASEVGDVGNFNVQDVGGQLVATEVADAGSINAFVDFKLALATTEIADVGAFNALEIDSSVLAVTEVADVGAFNVSGNVFGPLSSTEVADVGVFNGTVVDLGVLATTEVADAVEFDGGVLVSGYFGANESADVGAFSGIVDLEFVLATTEIADTGSFNVFADLEFTLATTEVADVGSINTFVDLQFALAVTETADVGLFSATEMDFATLATTEVADIGAVNGITGVLATVATTEVADQVSIDAASTDIALATTEVPDRALIQGNVLISGLLTATEIADQSAFSAEVGTGVALAVTEAADVGNFVTLLIFSSRAKFQWLQGKRPMTAFVRKNLLTFSGTFFTPPYGPHRHVPYTTVPPQFPPPPPTPQPQPTSVIVVLEFRSTQGQKDTATIPLTLGEDGCTWSCQWDSGVAGAGPVFWTVFGSGGVQGASQGQFMIQANPANTF